MKIKSLLLSLILAFSLILTALPVSAEIDADAKSLILMEASSGSVLFEKNADEKLPPASVTKVMTMLLVMEAIDSGKISLNDTVCVSELAASMGGSQIYLEVGEQMSVEDMLKSVVIASANDAACALAEFVCGSHDAFVDRMNSRAKELGMVNTHFENTNGLDDTTDTHLTSARDIALMSRELIVNHPAILKYSSTWQDTVRNGEFTLTNTNRLIKFYKGANGLKTGSTSKAKFCISASAERDGMQLIAVVMGSSTRDNRNATAKALFDYGFSNYSFVDFQPCDSIILKLNKGINPSVKAGYGRYQTVIDKTNNKNITKTFELPKSVDAPVKAGQKIGTVKYTVNGKLVGTQDIYILEDAEKMNFSELFVRIIKKYCLI